MTTVTDALDDCIDRLRDGATVPECLRAYPDHERELCPLLLVAERLVKLQRFRMQPAAQRRARQHFAEAVGRKLSGNVTRCTSDVRNCER